MSNTALINTKSGAGALVIPGAAPPPVVVEAITKALAAFPTPGSDRMSDDTSEAYYEAVGGFPVAVAVWSAKWLKWNNPRFTDTFVQPFFPADLRAVCQTAWEAWQAAIVRYYRDGGWCLSAHLYGKKLPSGARPCETGCFIPPDLVMQVLREWLAGVDVERLVKDRGALLTTSDEQFNLIPVEVFPDGLREELLAARKRHAEDEERERQRHAEEEAKEAEWRAYREQLGPELWAARHKMLMRSVQTGRMLSEAELIAQAEAFLEERGEVR